MNDWYKILGTARDADEAQIKAAYRKLAKKYHPDAHPGDKECEARFREITEAYTILSDPAKRKKYDEEFSSQAGQQKNSGSKGGGMGRGQRHPLEMTGRRWILKTFPETLNSFSVSIPRQKMW